MSEGADSGLAASERVVNQTIFFRLSKLCFRYRTDGIFECQELYATIQLEEYEFRPLSNSFR